ncbi:MAG: Fe-S cluster assembly protein SufD [Proteobacteria bacterium]|nr:Fe-S cluster assembly protein SufD [Pseudomonadota bacterium]
MNDIAQARAPAAIGAEGFLARYAGLRARLPGDETRRDAAAESFRARGLPTRRDEAWKYTDLRPVAALAFHEPLLATDTDFKLPPAPGARLVFVDGRFREDASRLPDGAAFTPFARAPRFDALARPEAHPLVALNTMLAEDGAVLTVPDGVDAGLVELVSIGAGGTRHPAAFHPRHAIRLGRGAQMTLLETLIGEGVYLHNPVMSVMVAEGAALAHVRLQNESQAAFHLATVYAGIAEGGTYDGFTLNLGARLCRTEIHTRLHGPGGAAHLNAAQVLRGVQHGDVTTVVAHDAPNCASRQTVKNVLDGRARGVFQGRIEVAQAAQKTDGYQMNQALLLSPDAEVDSKPELRIFADDVKCSHGATVGALDPDQLFYLRTRGVPEIEARAMLVRAFLDEALTLVSHPAARAALDGALSAWWEQETA